MNEQRKVKLFSLWTLVFLRLVVSPGFFCQVSKTENNLNRRVNALRQKRDLFREEAVSAVLSDSALHRSVLHNYTSRDASSEYCGCLNGGWCQDGGQCDCAQFQALGDRCQIIPNHGQDRDGICRSWGQHHFETFDGMYYYFPGTCSYILAKDCHSAVPRFTVWVHNCRSCRGSVYSCPRSLSLFFANEEEIHIRGYQVLKGEQRLTLPQTVHNVFIERLADYILVKSTFGFSLAWDGSSGVYLKMTEEHKGRPCGLCGNYNDDGSDDLSSSYGINSEDVAEFGNSWMVELPHEPLCTAVEDDFPGPCSSESEMDDAIEKCSALLFFPFISCHDNIDPNPFVASCVSDLCVSYDEETFCRTLVEYTRACSHVGYPVREWRDSFPSCVDGCEDSFVHRDCISCCPPTCTFEKECLGTNLHCLDGCYCPDGMILQNGTCIAVSQCPCVYHGTAYPLGHVLEQGCTVCVCMGGVWNCTENNCTSECTVMGDTHVTTFDGRIYMHTGKCQYVLVKSRGNTKFTVTVQYSACGESQEDSCGHSVTLVVDEDVSRQVTLNREGKVIIGASMVVSLPYTDDVVAVRRLTSVFVGLRASFGLKLHYDWRGGRIYLQLDSTWKGGTLGLCGTLNGNLRDDFLSPAGMIEGTPQLHANAWKLSSACISPVNVPIIDPCEMNQQNAFYASLCDVLTGEVFAACHAYVSPGVYYQQCRYQACRCGSGCMCTALAHYAYICFKHHITVYFRAHVSECGMICLGGMMYHPCTTSCGRTCQSVSSGEVCDGDCAEGCGCMDEMFYDHARQRCVPLSQCHCYFMGSVFQPGEVSFSSSGPCLCRNGRMECVPEEREPETDDCPNGKVYYNCRGPQGSGPSGVGVACEGTCRNLMLNLTCPPMTPCVSGCGCPAGLVGHNGECYYPENCPCAWLGLEYLPGETVDTPCYRCVCHRGFFNCTYFPCPAVCTIYSDRHYYTFDGLEYDYASDCQVYLIKSVGDTDISITAQNKDCYESGIVCMKNLLIYVGLTKIYFNDNSGRPSPSTVVGRGYEFELWTAGYYTVVYFPNHDLMVLWDRKTTIHIRAGPRWKGQFSGLCGNFDMVTVNDMTTAGHMEVSNAQAFGNSWALGQCESDFIVRRPCEGDLNRQPYAKRECGLLYSDVFASCHNVVDVTWFYKNCLTDTCNCNRGGDCECLCTSIAAYAHKCCQHGVTVQWRSPTVCPYDCEYYNQELGEGPFTLYATEQNDSVCVFGANTSSGEVFPLLKTSAQPTAIFNLMITSGLYKERASRVPTVSLESAERPNYFLCVTPSRTIRLERWRSDEDFRRQATFIHHQGLWLPGRSSFELHSQKGVFITLTHTHARAQSYDNSYSFKASSSFTIEESSFVIPYRLMCEWKYHACASACVKTCADPDATRCQFLPLVEGCFPRCPKTMVLDEITRRCVYQEDCSTLPPTPTPYMFVTRSNRTTTVPTTTVSTVVTTTSTTTATTSAPTSTSPPTTAQTTITTAAPTSASTTTTFITTTPEIFTSSPSTTESPFITPTLPTTMPTTPPTTTSVTTTLPPPTTTEILTTPVETTTSAITTTTFFTTHSTTITTPLITTETTPPSTVTEEELILTSTAETSPEPPSTTPSSSPTTPSSTTTLPAFVIPTGPCTPPFSVRVDDCSEYICFNGQLMLYNSSQHCRFNISQPQCNLLGMPIQINTDPCCPLWRCPCRCSIISDLRVITFDGNNVALYDNGSYILVHLPRENIVGHVEKCPTSESVNYIRRPTPTGGTSGLCFKKLNITTHAYRIIISRIDRKVSVNQITARLPFTRLNLHIDDTGTMYSIHTPSGISIQWYHSTGIMVLQYGAADNTSTRGLCGCCDGNPADDLRLPNGTVMRNVEDIPVFLHSWMVDTSEETEYFRRVGDNCTTGNCTKCFQMLNQSPFSNCHHQVSPEQFCEKIWAGDLHYKEHECDFLAAYVAICYTHQICFSWRKSNFCPLKCPPGKEYKPCVNTCKTMTCQNRDYYEESTCSSIREECVCKSGTILHRADSAFCVTEEQCVCTDNDGSPRAPGEVWNGSLRGCCLFTCLENGSVVPVEPECPPEPAPLCEREGEYYIDVLEEGACCPKKICECNQTICQNEVPSCEIGNKLMIGYSTFSCCPEYRCECDPMSCPSVPMPECKEDQFLVEVRGQHACCYNYLCVCESCMDPIPVCLPGEILVVDMNTTHDCCPHYNCVCDTSLCPETNISCATGSALVKRLVPGSCCPDIHCECQCDSITQPQCAVGEVQVEEADYSSSCGCTQYSCKKADVCLFQGVTVLSPGQSMVQYVEGELCYTVQCLTHRDSDTGFFAMDVNTSNCSEKCEPHQVYVPSPDPYVCCGSCKNVSCSFTNENGTTEVFTAGSSWVSNCTRFDCIETAVGAVILASGVVCPPFNDTECIQNGGVVQTYVDGCCKTCAGLGLLPFSISPVTPTASTNCDTGKEDGKTCKRVAIRTTIRKDDCRSNAPVTVYSCDGKCPSATIFNFNINSHARFCKCCRENGLQNRVIQLYCTRNATSVEYNYQEPMDCSCQWN
ncbi:otogelin-like protein isoform X1 [Silurus meridionalis]|uniref:otogelin-like protein isoform X1 n=1 Tax=Silurus meridionalis TaxID=175797 RepID=UPI001EEB37D1|nr:otogelin-like protein isoform X1 [Silurus meridionalis]